MICIFFNDRLASFLSDDKVKQYRLSNMQTAGICHSKWAGRKNQTSISTKKQTNNEENSTHKKTEQ